MAQCTLHSGRCGPRIVFARFKAEPCNLFVVGVCVPYSGRHNTLSDTLSEVEDIIARAPQHDCVVLLGDYISKLPRNTERRTGRWCIHNRANPAGTRLLELTKRRQLCAVYLPSISHFEVTTMRRISRKTLDMGPPRLTTSWPPVDDHPRHTNAA